MIEFRVSAPGKLILYGEHAVVYGKTAIAASLDLRSMLHFKELPEAEDCAILSMPKIRLRVRTGMKKISDFFSVESCPNLSSDGHEKFLNYIVNFVDEIHHDNQQQKFALQTVFYLLVSISQMKNVAFRPFEITMDTALSISSGLGSSASFSVCLAAAFIHWSNKRNGKTTIMNDEQLAIISKCALNCERIMHGNPSGVDNSVCTYGSIIEFRRGDEIVPIKGVKTMRVLLVDTRVQRSTKLMVEKLARLRRKYTTIFTPILETIDRVSREATGVIERSREIPDGSESLREAYEELTVLIEVNQGLLATCQVSHPSLDRICAEAKNYGLAAKLTGAGGGGYAYILLLPETTNEVITSITKKLIANGYLVTLTNLGGPGVTLHD